MKKIIVAFIVLFLFQSCTQDKKNDLNSSGKPDVDSISGIQTSNNNHTDLQNIVYVKPNSIVFFSLSQKEYNQFIHLTGNQTKWEFDIIYKQFKKLAQNTKKALKNKKIKSVYLVNPKIAFITKKGDTLFFDRKENDLFIGQIFFNGKDTLDIEQGLMKTDSLENYIKRFFNLKEDINIKQTIIHSVNQKIIKKDTVIKSEPDTLNIQ